MIGIGGCAALAVAMGIGRFAFTPLLPLMVGEGRLAGETGAWLAAANYLGYLLGAMSAGRLPAPPRLLMGASLLAIVLLTAAMGGVGSLALWMGFRLCAGLFSAWALVGTSAWVLQHLAAAGRPDLAGLVYAGVGLGIALVGFYCLIAARPGVSTDLLWLGLGAIGALGIAPVLALLRHRQDEPKHLAARPAKGSIPAGCTDLVVCYGCFGFGYILPATFIPVLARQIIADPQVFGWAWPVFGLAAAGSTLAASRLLRSLSRLRVWGGCHVLMGIGTLLPSLWLSAASIAVAATLVGGTFMVVTMAGLQEAGSRAVGNPTTILGRLTAAFAFGQLAGPVVSAILGRLAAADAGGLDQALRLAALALFLSGVHLWRRRA